MDNQPAATTAEEAARPPVERAFLAASVPSGSEEPLRYAGAGAHGRRLRGRTHGDQRERQRGRVRHCIGLQPSRLPRSGRRRRASAKRPRRTRLRGRSPCTGSDLGATELVSRCRFECGQGAAAGAAEPVAAVEEAGRRSAPSRWCGRFPEHGEDGSWPGASISADGSTVAWMGEDVAQQAPTLARNISKRSTRSRCGGGCPPRRTRRAGSPAAPTPKTRPAPPAASSRWRSEAGTRAIPARGPSSAKKRRPPSAPV